MEAIPNFLSPSEEIQYWKKKAETFEQQAKEVRDEFQEFQDESRELEQELESQLEQTEKKLKEFKSLSNRLHIENDSLKDRLEQCNREYNSQISELQTELSEIKSIREHLNKYIRELEQQNDDLERAKRETLASLEDFESRMNVAIERNAFLESELDEKEALKAVVQRMKDETRDLRAEVQILAGKQRSYSRETSFDTTVERPGGTTTNGDIPDNDRSLLMLKCGGSSVEKEANNNLHMMNRKGSPDSNKLADDVESRESWLQDTPPSSAKSSPSANGKYGPPLTPSARLSALSIVGDLLRKVGALELKLSSCRNIVKENHVTRSTPGTPTSSGITGASSMDGSLDADCPAVEKISSRAVLSSGRARRFSRSDSVPKKIVEH